MNDIDRLEKEKAYLEFVKKLIEKEIIVLEENLIEIPKQYRKRYSDVAGGDEDLVDTLLKQTAQRISKLKIALNNCYFGMFEFTDNAIKDKEKFYIGKTTISDSSGQVFTLDWRAPICSLYYDQKMDDASYTSGNDIYTGTVNSKSQVRIKNGVLEDIIDTDFVTSDELIVSFLKQSVGSKMKDIVASIQHEQNEIIRAPFKKNIIVQGVAGSGKTSVALHRVAYLLYNEKKYKPEQFLVIGPNSCFNDYISMVLPSLDSEGIRQMTKSGCISEFSSVKLKKSIHEKTQSISSYKSSMKYKKDIDSFIEAYLDQIDYSVNYNGFEVLSSEKMKAYLKSSSGNIKNKFEIAMKKASTYIRDYQDEIKDRLRKEFKLGTINLEGTDEFEFMMKLSEELKTGCKSKIKKEYMKYFLKPDAFYKIFIENFDIYCYKLSNDEIRELQKTTLDNLSKKTLTDEDLTALMYIESILQENRLVEDIVHVIIDEAQDYGEFDFYVLKRMFKNSTFSIFGDLAQSIYSYKSIDDWDTVNTIMFNDKGSILKLNQSYRTTKQISLESNFVLQRLGLDKARPVLREGKEVVYDSSDNIINIIKKAKESGYNTIAVLCKDCEDAVRLEKYLKHYFSEINLVNNDDSTYQGGLCVIDVLSAKGLEFDAVIIADASEEKYSTNSDLDMKKLYVALTRSLHELVVCSNGELTRILDKENNKVISKKYNN